MARPVTHPYSLPKLNLFLMGQVLHTLDAKVDGVINAATGLYPGGAVGSRRRGKLDSGDLCEEEGALAGHLSSLTAAKDVYLQRVEDAIQLLRVRTSFNQSDRVPDTFFQSIGKGFARMVLACGSNRTGRDAML